MFKVSNTIHAKLLVEAGIGTPPVAVLYPVAERFVLEYFFYNLAVLFHSLDDNVNKVVLKSKFERV